MPNIRSLPNKRKHAMMVEALSRSNLTEFTNKEVIELTDTYFSECGYDVSDRSLERYLAKCVRRQYLKKVNSHYELP